MPRSILNQPRLAVLETDVASISPTVTKLDSNAGATVIFNDPGVVTIYLDMQTGGQPYYTVSSGGAGEYASTIMLIKDDPMGSTTVVQDSGTDTGGSSPFYFGSISESFAVFPDGVGSKQAFTLTPTTGTHSSYMGEILWGDMTASTLTACCVVHKY